ncbi:iron-sulfur cluster assembly scaffold protein [Altericroceibacterium xinjiangense]|uniref:iron-sulfur cluster assembly scaffold protein n=1 Tax=Altericroceibacterium xinjiangense TaxID=762261 RepID=UPI000F7F7399|nr:iron-sulfur cluster assembly scaffold protein [Altericroceibacterium xinjiangense]
MSAEKLYTPELLALTLELAQHRFDETLPLHGQARSQSCGSTLAMAIQTDTAGLIASFGMKVQACAIGQASAAIFARHALGKNAQETGEALHAIERWLAGEGALPAWPDFAMLKPAGAYPGRHGAILLPWRAAADALSTPPTAR